MHIDLTEAQRRIVTTLLAAPRAWATQARLRSRGGPLSDILGLAALGLLASWEVSPSRGPFWTLTPWGATVLDVEIVEAGEDEVPRWAEVGLPHPPIRVRHHRGVARLPFPERVPDPRPWPVDILIDRESGEPVRLWGRTIPREKPKGGPRRPEKGRRRAG